MVRNALFVFRDNSGGTSKTRTKRLNVFFSFYIFIVAPVVRYRRLWRVKRSTAVTSHTHRGVDVFGVKWLFPTNDRFTDVRIFTRKRFLRSVRHRSFWNVKKKKKHLRPPNAEIKHTHVLTYKSNTSIPIPVSIVFLLVFHSTLVTVVVAARPSRLFVLGWPSRFRVRTIVVVSPTPVQNGR